MIKQLVMAVTVATLLWGASTSRATMIYSTLGPGDSFNPGPGWYADNVFNPAVPFTVTGTTYSFASVELGIIQDGFLNILLMSDSGGLPGQVIESIPLPHISGLVTATSVLHPSLTEGTTYWIAARGLDISGAGWRKSFPEVNGTLGYSQNGGKTWFTSTNPLPAIRVNGDVPNSSAPVPEPGSLTLALLGIVSVVGLSYRKWKTAVR